MFNETTSNHFVSLKETLKHGTAIHYHWPIKHIKNMILSKGVVVCSKFKTRGPGALTFVNSIAKKSAINVSENVYLYSKMHYHEKMYILYIDHWHLYYYVRLPNKVVKYQLLMFLTQP